MAHRGLLSVHLFGLTLLLGSVVVTSLNLLGLFQPRKPAARLRREVRPVLLTGLTLSMVTGTLIFTGGAQPYYEGYWFRLKMVLLATTLLFHFTVYRAGEHRARGPALTADVPGDRRVHAGVVVRRRVGGAGDRVFLT